LYRKYRRGFRNYPDLPGRIHYNDDSFYNSSKGHYISVGLSALENIERALRLSGLSLQDIKSCLDFPCGYGRITRFLRAELPEWAVLDVCDIVPEAVDFCRKEFGSTPILSQEDISKVILPRRYDLIWIGSLLTHLDKKGFSDALTLAASSLVEHGILVFTTHGCYSLEILDSYGIPDMDRNDVEKQLQGSGFYYSPYPGESNYGISLNTEDYVRSLIEKDLPTKLMPLFFERRGWDSHQDVFAYQKIRGDS